MTNSIKQAQILEAVEACCLERGLILPSEFRADFEMCLGNLGDLTSFNAIRKQLCERVKMVLDVDETLSEKYAFIFWQIYLSVRLRLARVLGLREYLDKPVESYGASSKQILKEFLESLSEGESWDLAKLSRWTKDGDNIGSKLHARVRAIVGRWTEESVREILDNEADVLLKRNPFEKEEKRIRDWCTVRHYLIEYLKTLNEGQSWSPETLWQWEFPDGVHGFSLIMWVSNNTDEGRFSLSIVSDLLGSKADEYLRRNPFERKEYRVPDIEAARRYLLEFLEQLSEGESWSWARFDEWTSPDGVRGRSVCMWIYNDLGGFDEAKIREVLGESAAELFAKHPFEKQEKKITDVKIAKCYLLEFMASLSEGVLWSSTTLQATASIGADGIKGGTLYMWILTNYPADGGGIDEKSIRTVLGDSAGFVLARNPFEVLKEDRLTSRETARHYLVLFLRSLAEGAAWSPNTLQQHGEVSDNVYGYSIYSWIARNEAGGFCRNSVVSILGNEAELLLARNPFEHEIRRINTLEDAKKYLLLFLDSLPEGKLWSPSYLMDYGSIGDDGPTGDNLYCWLQGNICREGTIDWLYILMGVLPHEYLEKHPFEKQEKKITDVKIAKHYLLEFMAALLPDTSWSCSTLKDAVCIGQDEIKGNTLYEWLLNNYRAEGGGVNEGSIRAVLGDDADAALARNPFEHKIGRINTLEDAKKYLLLFLDSLPEGKSWSPSYLMDYGCIGDDGPTGDNLYLWLKRNVRREGTIDWLYILIKMLSHEYLKKHPFVHKDMGVVSVKTGAAARSRRPATTTRREKFGVPDAHMSDPEMLLLRKEEQPKLKRQRDALRRAILKLSISDFAFVQKFYKIELITNEELLALSIKLRLILEEMEPGLFDAEEEATQK